MKEYKYNYKRIAVRLDKETHEDMEFLINNTNMNFSKFIRERIKEKAKEEKEKEKQMNIELFKKQFQYEVDLDNAILTASKEIKENSFNINHKKFDEFRDDEEFINAIKIEQKKYR